MKVARAFFFSVYLVSILACNKSKTPPIPILQISCDSVLDNKVKKPCQLSYSSSIDRFKMDIELKRRGGWSIQFPKHSYTLELAEGYPLAGLALEDDWILNASYIDKSFIRHSLSYQIFREMHPENRAPNFAYFQLYFNREYRGLYILMERLDRKRLGVRKVKHGGFVFKEPPVFHKPNSVQDPNNYYHQKYPELNEADGYSYLDEFRDFLFESSDSAFADPDHGINKWVDLRNLADWHILLLLSNNNDGTKKNFYLYRVDNDHQLRIAPWDYDHAYGRDGDNELNFLDRYVQPERSKILQRLLETNAFNYKNKMAERWFELRQDQFQLISLQETIASISHSFQDYIPENANRWPVDAPAYYDASDFDAEIKLIETYLEMRLPQLDSLFQNYYLASSGLAQ